MCGSETLTTVVSSTSMKVANMTATATIHGLTWGCGSAEDGIRYYFHDAAKPPSDAWSCQCPSLWGGQSCPQPAFLPAGPAGKRVRSLKGLPHKAAAGELLFRRHDAVCLRLRKSVLQSLLDIDVAGISPQRLAHLRDSFLPVAQFQQRHRQVCPNPRVLRQEFQRGAVFLQRPANIARLLELRAAVVDL